MAKTAISLPPASTGSLHLPESAYACALAEAWTGKESLLFIARDMARMQHLAESLPFFLPGVDILTLPGWDCLPYDRVSPNIGTVSQRLESLSRLALNEGKKPLVLLTTLNAASQRLVPRDIIRKQCYTIKSGDNLDRDTLVEFLTHNGYIRSAKVMEPGEFAVRGSILDIFPTGAEDAVRIDCFGDQIEEIRSVDPLSQLSRDKLKQFQLLPAGEVVLEEASIQRFRKNYREQFGAALNHALYQTVSEGRRYPGMEHWLPLFHDRLESLFDYLPASSRLFLDYQLMQAFEERQEIIRDYHQARLEFLKSQSLGEESYHPLPPNALYLTPEEWVASLQRLSSTSFSPFQTQDEDNAFAPAVHFAQARQQHGTGQSLMQEVATSIRQQQASGQKVAIAAASIGARERLRKMLEAQQLHLVEVADWKAVEGLSPKAVGLATVPLATGFRHGKVTILAEADIFGDRSTRTQKKKKASDQFFAEAASFTPGELVVHEDHGIGRFHGLVTMQVANVPPHDCLEIRYDGDDKLFVPVENIDVLTRYGSDDLEAKLDKLGGVGWQNRKAKLKKRIKMAAEELLKIAAERALAKAPVITPVEGMYDEFCARFPFAETDDQLRAIEEVAEDLRLGRPMDRLICGDVGFGKTEVALRAAFLAACPVEGEARRQVAVICPTTLLARQHYRNFKDRFKDLPFRIRQLSRLVPAKDAKAVKAGLKSGEVDIVIGTHALLASDVEFANLGMLVIDEEQHFGVKQKEKIKNLRSEVHVLTLSATPIPRTLQMALTGIKELSLITTPPVDRLAVRTFVTPYDPVTLREALQREHFRGGQVFYVCPRISDVEEVLPKLKTLVPEMKVIAAHGQMAPAELDAIMNDFYDGKFDILLCTTIIESGIDVPNANTLIVHHAHRFGLGQLYQLRGRVGRGKSRAYAYFTLSKLKQLTPTALKRLEVMQQLDMLGAGFSIASHDMDIRGFGNLLGDEQSGHIREVGVELYQHMLEEAVEKSKREGAKRRDPLIAAEESEEDDHWSPQISLGLPVLIPEAYISDLSLRMGLYKRSAGLKTEDELEAFNIELIDRFGPLPDEVQNLLETVRLKQLCLAAGVEKLEAGPKGAVLSFRKNSFANPMGLLALIQKQPTRYKLRADQKLFIAQELPTAEARLKAIFASLRPVVELAIASPPLSS